MMRPKLVAGMAFSSQCFAIAVVSGSDCVYNAVRKLDLSLTTYEKLRILYKEIHAICRHLELSSFAIVAYSKSAKAGAQFPTIAAREIRVLARRRCLAIRRVRHASIHQFLSGSKLSKNQTKLFPDIAFQQSMTSQQRVLQREAAGAAILASFPTRQYRSNP